MNNPKLEAILKHIEDQAGNSNVLLTTNGANILVSELEKLKAEKKQLNQEFIACKVLLSESEREKEKAEKIVEDLKIYYKHFAQSEFNGSFLASEILNKTQEFENGK